MDSEKAKAVLRAILNRAEGKVGRFIRIKELAATPAFTMEGADVVVEELLSLHWLYKKGNSLCISRWGVEYAIEWTDAKRVLRAISTVAGGRGGKVVAYADVVTAAGLRPEETDRLVSELSVLGLADRGGRGAQFVYVSIDGLRLLAGEVSDK